jgi:hypothetical protein
MRIDITPSGILWVDGHFLQAPQPSAELSRQLEVIRPMQLPVVPPFHMEIIRPALVRALEEHYSVWVMRLGGFANKNLIIPDRHRLEVGIYQMADLAPAY